MKLDYPFLQLPVSFDAAVIASEIEALGESVWRAHPQGFPGNSALPLVSVDGDPGSVASPREQVAKWCARRDIPRNLALDELTLSRHMVTPPNPDKWRKHEVVLARVLPSVAATRARAEPFMRDAGADR